MEGRKEGRRGKKVGRCGTYGKNTSIKLGIIIIIIYITSFGHYN